MPDDTNTTNPLFGTNSTEIDGLITNAGALGATSSSTVADIQYGAQLGYGPNLPQIDGATPLILAPVVAIVTHVPTMFADIDNASDTLKALVERHAKEITGIDFGYQLEGQGTPVGHDSQELHMPTNSKRTPVTPTFVWPELAGNLVWNFHRMWIERIKHPDTQASSMTSSNLDSTMSPMLMSSFTMDVLFLQFDPTLRPENLIDAWFITNMWPQETGMFGAKRQIGHSEMPERQIAYYGILQHNPNTKAAGQIVAQALGLHKVNFDFAVPFFAPGGTPGAIDTNLSDMGLDEATKLAITDFTNLDPNAQTS